MSSIFLTLALICSMILGREKFYEELVAFNENSTNVEEDMKTITSIPGKNTPRNTVLVLV